MKNTIKYTLICAIHTYFNDVNKKISSSNKAKISIMRNNLQIISEILKKKRK